MELNNFEYSDEVLVSYVHERDERAEELLYKKYHSLVEAKVRKYSYQASKVGLDTSDLYQEGMIGLSQAIRDFQETKNVKFSTFANLCIEREIQSCVLKAKRKKHSMLNESVSLNKDVFEDSSLIEYVSSNVPTPEDIVINYEQNKIDAENIKKYLTKLELEVFKLKYHGYNYLEIAKIMKRSPKSIDNALQRIKKKLGNFI